MLVKERGRVGVEYGRSPRSRSRTDPQGVGQAWWLPRRDPLAVKTVVNKGTSSLREETNLLAPSEALRVTMCLYIMVNSSDENFSISLSPCQITQQSLRIAPIVLVN